MLARHIIHLSKRSSSALAGSSISKYPHIISTDKTSIDNRERETFMDKINVLGTVEEKLFYQNLQKYYGTNCFVLTEGEVPVNFLAFVKFVTRTRLIEADNKLFHELIKFNIPEARELLDRIRLHLQDALLFEILGRNRKNNEGLSNTHVNSVIERINDVLLSSLSMQYQHHLDSTVDYNPRVGAFWLTGNFHPSPEVFKKREKKKTSLEKDNKTAVKPVPIDIDPLETVEHFIQYIGHPVVQLRCNLPLRPLNTDLLIESESEFDTFLSEPFYSPSLQYGMIETRRNGFNLPGFWPGDQKEFGLISYHNFKTPSDGINSQMVDMERKLRLQSQAILGGFSWLHAQAMMQGFSTYSELSYPLTSQQVFTDGRHFAFSLYQLNTILMHKKLSCPSSRTNLCVTLPLQPLYQDIQNNQFIGWNDSVVLNLLALYLNTPALREGIEMKPHLNPLVQVVANINDNEKREWLHNQFRHMYSNRPRHRTPYEVFDWERIYKVSFNTKSMDARKRPFERDQNPSEERKYWDHMPPYIPKKFRAKKMNWNGWRANFKKTYYPEP